MTDAADEQPKAMESLDPNTTVARAYLIMDRLGLDTLPVVCDGLVVGTISLHQIEELISKYSKGLSNPGTLTVGNHMQGSIAMMDSNHPLAGAIRKILDDRVQSIVIRDGASTVGVMSREKLLKLLAELSEKLVPISLGEAAFSILPKPRTKL